jgi:hypothetical protein
MRRYDTIDRRGEFHLYLYLLSEGESGVDRQPAAAAALQSKAYRGFGYQHIGAAKRLDK